MTTGKGKGKRSGAKRDNASRGVFTVIQLRKDALFLLGWQFDFLWNLRKMNDGERTAAMIRAAEGRRLRYKAA